MLGQDSASGFAAPAQWKSRKTPVAWEVNVFKERNAISSSQTLEEAEVGCGRGHCFSELLSGGTHSGLHSRSLHSGP